MDIFDIYNTKKIMQETEYYRESFSVVSLSKSALLYNAQQYKKVIGHNSFLALVVKGNAYGHGIKEISLIADNIKEIDILCCFFASEALYLRSIGIKKTIYVMGHVEEYCFEHQLIKLKSIEN